MARKSRITRSICTTNLTLMCVDTESAEIFNQDVKIPGKVSEKEALKQAKKQYENEKTKVVDIVTMTTDAKLYAMDEDVFIANAEVVGESRKK